MVVRRVKHALENLKAWITKYRPSFLYNPEKFFRERHDRYGFDLRSVGNCTLSHEENRAAYDKAGLILLDLLEREGVDLRSAKILDIGCGTGYYAELFKGKEVENYLGLDIMDGRFEILSQRFTGYKFQKMDITREQIPGLFDLIIMVDVTQHIVDDRKFSAAMQNIGSHLSDDGVFVVTSWLAAERTRRRYYEVARPMDCYRNEFGDYHFSEAVPFRDKFIFSIRKHSCECNCDR